VFDVRAPYVVLPLVSVLTLMMALAPLGVRGAVALAAAAPLAGALAWALFPGARTLALAAPFLLAALAATALKLAHVQGRPRRRAFLLVPGALVLVVAANPPTYVAGLAIPDGASLALGALGVGAGALLLAAAARSRARLRETGIYVIHLAVVLGLLGYAASTYSQTREVFAAQPLGTTVHVGPYDAAVGAADVAQADGRLDRVHVPLHLTRAGGEAGGSGLDFAWRGDHYQPRLEVRRTLLEDVYVSPLAFHTLAAGWVGSTTSTGQRVSATDVDAVTFSVTVLPLMNLVWAGLWMGAAGMGMVLASGISFPTPRERYMHEGPSAAPIASMEGADR
jgi:hypothetical protein